MKPEDLVVGQEYMKDGRSYFYIGPDDVTGRYVFRQDGMVCASGEFSAWNYLGIERLTPKPGFFEEGKTYVHKFSTARKEMKVEAVREGPDGLGPAALVLYSVNTSNPFWTVKRPADYATEGGLPVWVEQ